MQSFREYAKSEKAARQAAGKRTAAQKDGQLTVRQLKDAGEETARVSNTALGVAILVGIWLGAWE